MVAQHQETTTSTTTTTTSTTQYKADIILRLGGDSMFDFIIMTFVELIKNDPQLNEFFGQFTTEDLVIHETQFLKTIFRKHPEDYDVNGHIVLRNYDIIQRGYTEQHFDIMIHQHFVRAMKDSWIDNDTITDAVDLLMEFRPLFERKQEQEQQRVQEEEKAITAFLDASIRSTSSNKSSRSSRGGDNNNNNNNHSPVLKNAILLKSLILPPAAPSPRGKAQVVPRRGSTEGLLRDMVPKAFKRSRQGSVTKKAALSKQLQEKEAAAATQ